jgi:hypothetical protein
MEDRSDFQIALEVLERSKSNGIRNRHDCNMGSSIVPSSSAGRVRALSSSTTISGGLARALKGA